MFVERGNCDCDCDCGVGADATCWFVHLYRLKERESEVEYLAEEKKNTSSQLEVWLHWSL